MDAYGQGHIQGEFIVRLHQDFSLEKFGAQHRLEHLKVLSTRARIHLFKSTKEVSSNADDWATLRQLRGDFRVESAQFNHVVQERETVPNDPNFSQQWHHMQAEDHDIDSELAWVISQGGTAANGSCIVVAVLEGGGSNYNHVDLIDNHWVNVDEIPNNGIDDDENGFVDDYNGWNTNSNSNTISAGSHGTAVSGMIGATGNNGVGGAGVNWDVEVMQVQMGGLTEDNVIAAYNYPFEMRAQFNESQGERGAFVVATNASWGLDLADPSNYPVWCGYYDVLGSAGILNCGATANQAYNIDTQGDMPTGCNSPYMIAVTATNDEDVRTFSAYGLTTIDLAAPGESVHLPSGSSGYSNTSGTSFASPCVAGAIALIYSAPCSELMELALGNPQAAADLVRGYILDGTDLVDNLIGETVTGGRLNVANSMNLAMANCGQVECFPDSVSAMANCVYDSANDTVLTQIQMGIELSSFLCSTSTICQWNDAVGGEPSCDSIAINSGGMFLIDSVYPGSQYELYYTVDGWGQYPITVTTPACDSLVPGCTGITATNYDPAATIDDGTCVYPCEPFAFALTTDCFPNETGWTLLMGDSVVASVSAGEFVLAEEEYIWEGCITEGCYTLVVSDSYGDGLNGAQWWWCGVNGEYTGTSGDSIAVCMEDVNFGSQAAHSFCLPAIPGCTNPEACNFEETANADDCSCTLPGENCDDGDEETVLDTLDESCNCQGVPAVYGCTNPDACNFNAFANVEDGSCYSVGQGSISGQLFPQIDSEQGYTYSGGEANALLWSVQGGSIVSGQSSASVLVNWMELGPGVLTLVESDGQGCEATMNFTVSVLAEGVTGLNELAGEEISLFPNPASDVVRCLGLNSDNQNLDWTVFDVQGKEVLHRRTTQTLSVQSLSRGHYTVQIQLGEDAAMLPLLVR